MKANVKLRPLGAVLACLLSASGCSSITTTPTGQSTSGAVSTEQVEVLYQQPQRPYEVIALVSSDAATIFSAVPGEIEKCRQAAAKVGADALIVTATFDPSLGRPAKVSGQAIRWKK